MNNVYPHLLLSHIPVIGIVFSIMLLITANIMKSNELKRVATGCFVLIAIAASVAYFSGEGAEESVEHFSWASESLIEQHEKWAHTSLIATGLLGIVALIILAVSVKTKRLPVWSLWGLLILGLISAGFMARTANLGGKIRHTEILSASQTTHSYSNNQFEMEEATEKHKSKRHYKHPDDDD